MKYLSFFLAGAALVSAEASILERQVQIIVGVVNQINTATQSLDTAVKGYTGGDASAILSEQQKVANAVSEGISTVNGVSSITLTDAVQIQGQVQNLQQSAENVVNNLISKKSDLLAAGQGGSIETSLVAQLKGANALAAAISSKVPPEVQQLAQQLSAGISSALQKGVDAFAGSPSSGSGSGAGSSSGSTGSSGSSGSSSGGSAVKPAVTTSAVPKPATFAGAASRTTGGAVAGVVAFCAIVLAL